MSDEIFDHLQDGKGSLEKEIFPKLAELRRVGMVKFPMPPFYWWSVKTESDLKIASEGLEKLLRQQSQNAQPAQAASDAARADRSVRRSS